MRSQWIIGAVALGALAIAIETLAIVDATTGSLSSCSVTLGACADPVLPLGLLAVGALAALGAIVPAIGWMQSVARERRVENADTVARDLVTVRAARGRAATGLDDDDL